MPDRLMVLVPRQVEDEPGHRSQELFWKQLPGDIAVTDAFREPVSGRWMGKPHWIESAEEASDWTPLPPEQDVVTVEPRLDLGGGVLITGEGSLAAPWGIQHATDLEVLRGFGLAFLVYEPEDPLDLPAPLTIEWADKWRLEMRGSAAGAQQATVSEKTGTDPSADPWEVRGVFPLLRGQFYGQMHLLWWQPLDADEFLLRNREHDDLGAVIRTETPTDWDLDIAAEEEEVTQQAPWGPGPLVIRGVPRTFLVFQHVVYPGVWSIETTSPRTLDYDSTQGVTVEARAFLPDGHLEGNSDYSLTVAVFEGELDGDPWEPEPAGQRAYSYRVTATGPADNGDGGESFRALVLDRMSLEWPLTTASDGLVAVDLYAAAGVGVAGVAESRGPSDAESALTVGLYGELSGLAPYRQPNTRCQWQLDTGEVDELGAPVYYIRFDGLLDRGPVPRGALMDGTYFTEPQLVFRSRWRQAEHNLLRQEIPADGMLRSEVYEALAAAFPLDITTEFEIQAGGLTDDAPVPAAKRGQRPLFEAQIGTRLSDLFLHLQSTLGPNDRIRFVERPLGEAAGMKLYIDQPTDVSQATFYRTSADAETNLVPGQVLIGRTGEKTRLLTLEEDDSEYSNCIWVVGQKPAALRDAEGAERAELIIAYWDDPTSWQGGGTYYVGERRPLIVVDPTVQTRSHANQRLYQLWKRFGRFTVRGTFQSQLVRTLYPGDVITIAAGSEPGGASTKYRITGMRTRVDQLSLPEARRYDCTYEIEGVV